MGQLLIRQVDDGALEQLRARARAEKTSVEALARRALHEAARLTTDEQLALVERMQAWSRRVRNPSIPHTLGVDLIREDRDRDR